VTLRRATASAAAALAKTIGGAATLVACTSGGYVSLGRNATHADGGDAGAAPFVGSGLPWASGINVSDPAGLRAWKAFRGRENDVALVLTDYTTWDTITRPDALLDEFAGFGGKLVIAQPMWPDKSGGSTKACAAGNYDVHWRAFGTTLTAHGRQASIIRLAWQFNGNDVEWAASDPPSFIACYQHIARAIREGAPEAVMDWSMNAHGTDSPPGGDAFDSYPGDDYVDVIGIDTFDMTPASPDEAAFLDQCNGPDGICNIADTARRRGKRLGVGQWCVVTCGFDDRGNDNPFYVERMHQLFVENADIMAYETYYDDRKSGYFCTSLNDPDRAPAASARYKALWGP
jgi:hypothetical protein